MELPNPNLVARYKNAKHYLSSLVETVRANYPAKDLTVIGVTGTDGKTTTAHLIYEILKEGKFKVALISTVGAWGPKGFLDTGLHTTTPDAKVLQPLLAKFRSSGVTHVVLETTSHGLDQHRVFGANFWAGVLTNVTHEHLDYHKTFKKYRQAKAKLFKKVKVAVLNKDDDSFGYFKRKTNKNTKVISYSLAGMADIKAGEIKEKKSGLDFLATDNGVGHRITTVLSGKYNVSNILAAIGITRALGVDWKTIQKSVKNFRGIPGRMEHIKTRPFQVIVDFAHTPNALEKLLQTLKVGVGTGRLIAIFGCAGERDYRKRPMMGGVASRLADISIFTAEDPRSESLEKILAQMEDGARLARAREFKPTNYNRQPTTYPHIFIREPDRAKAISLGIKLAKKGDIVVICGKGHEKSLAFVDGEHPWSDQEEAKKALKNLKRKR